MKICFVTHNVYPILEGKHSIESAGGAELQQSFIGEALKKRGYKISYISMDYGQEDRLINKGIEILKTYKLHEGISGIRFLYPIGYKILRALKRANADIYYVRCAGYLPGIAAIFCKIYNKKMIYAGAHETDFIPSQSLLKKQHEKLLYAYGLKHADAIIAQTYSQKKNLWKSFKRNSEVIRNFFPFHANDRLDVERKTILWVSTLRSWKRPLQFLGLAKSFPAEEFVMIGGSPAIGSEELYNEVKQKAAKIPNLNFLGFQPFHITEKYFDNCKVFINTSINEGFPNTFLQSWSRGIPVISYVDPDGVIKKHQLGLVVDSEDQLHIAFSKFLSMREWDYKIITRYFLQNHSNNIIDNYESIFLRLMKHG